MNLHPYCRPLDTNPLIRDFLRNVLQIKLKKDALVVKIRQCENEIKTISKEQSTLLSEAYRDGKHSSNDARWELRAQIVHELSTLKRLPNDDNIKLGPNGAPGGALPHSDIQKNKQAFYIIGPPGSGKSTIGSQIADQNGAIILDSDYSKRKLPEYRTNFAGANIVHEESTAIIWAQEDRFYNKVPGDFTSLSKFCISEGLNIVIPKIGNILKDGILSDVERLKSAGYAVHLTLVSLDRRVATIRALERFEKKKGNRYVPLSLIFDGFANEPILNYYRCKNFHSAEFASFGKLTTENHKIEILDYTSGNPISMFM